MKYPTLWTFCFVHFFIYPFCSSVPDKPDRFQVVNRGKLFLDVSWERPSDGVISGYELTWKVVGSGTTDSHTLTETSYQITGLTAETSYDLTVVAVSNDQKSGARSLTRTTCKFSWQFCSCRVSPKHCLLYVFLL